MASVVSSDGDIKPDVLIATPTHSGDVHAIYCQSLLHTCAVLGAVCQLNCQPFFVMGNAVISFARALALHKFMEIGAEYLFFIDSDMGWDPAGAVALIQSPHEFVAGVYPAKTPDLTVSFQTRGIRESNTGHYVETDGVPGGFMRLKRSAVEKMYAAYPELKVTYHAGSVHEKDVYLLFENMIVNGEPLGEDYAFCERWRRIGGKIFIWPQIDFVHYGKYEWRGNMARDDRRLAIVDGTL